MTHFQSRHSREYECSVSFTEDSYIDNTHWTLMTHSVSAIVYLLAAVKLYFLPHSRRLSSPCNCLHQSPTEYTVPMFLCVTSISHGLAALHTATAKSAEDLNPLIIASNLYAAVGSGLVLYLSLAVVQATPECIPNVWFILVVAASVAPIWAVIYNFEVIEGIDLHMCFLAAYYLLLPLSYSVRIFETIEKSFFHYLFKFVAFVTILISMSYTYNFYWKCGSYIAYKNCFEDCPLPHGVNQTSFFNITKMISLVCWAWAEDRVPSVCFKQFDEPEDDTTVISDGFSFDDDLMMDKDHTNSDEIENLEEQNHSFDSTRSSTTEEDQIDDSDSDQHDS
ncbi:unnamed protein product [Cylindrotheca closterium]|uniref:Uncharacterized protein n=1 Tax=Cylindrotheca closterium TaxID=2856 RepID=A0AAD2CLU0_9STRA|nr:unnamed protein product [Cylindrotheca closterium]